MNRKHKHYNEIVAWAEGKQIQWRRNGQNNWLDCYENEPTWVVDFEYRVKPEPRTIWVNEFDGDLAGTNWDTKEDAERNVKYGEAYRRVIKFVEVVDD